MTTPDPAPFTIRRATLEDAATSGRICFQAFHAISTAHNFPPDLPSAEVASGFLTVLFAHPGMYCVVAESAGRVIGSNCLDERSQIAGVGPITIDPTDQNVGVGRALMQAVMQRADERNFPGIRLVQAAFHNRSLSLYTKLGFQVREPLSTMIGPPIGKRIEGYAVRKATASDLDAATCVCVRVHGHHRRGELADAVTRGTAVVVERDGRITGYATAVGFFGHTVAESNRDLQAILAATPVFDPPGFLVPSRNAELFRWCLDNGLRVTQPMTLMSKGLYNEPDGAFLPSIIF